MEAHSLLINLDNGLNLISNLVYYLPKKVPVNLKPNTVNCDRTMIGFVVNNDNQKPGTMKEHPV